MVHRDRSRLEGFNDWLGTELCFGGDLFGAAIVNALVFGWAGEWRFLWWSTPIMIYFALVFFNRRINRHLDQIRKLDTPRKDGSSEARSDAGGS